MKQYKSWSNNFLSIKFIFVETCKTNIYFFVFFQFFSNRFSNEAMDPNAPEAEAGDLVRPKKPKNRENRNKLGYGLLNLVIGF